MALDTTRGLPSFSEMYAAMKNRGSLGEALKTGFEGYRSGVKANMDADTAKADQELKAAQAQEALANAKYKGTPHSKKVPLAALPESIKGSLAAYVDEQGMVPEEAAKVALGTTAQGQRADQAEKELKMREDMLSLREELAKKEQQHQSELNRIREESGNANRELNATRAVAESAGKVAEPTLVERGVSGVKEAFGGQPLASILAEKQRQAAEAKLAQMGGLQTPTPQPAPIAQPKPAMSPKKGQGSQRNPIPVYTEDDYNALPSGAWFVDDTGKPTQKR